MTRRVVKAAWNEYSSARSDALAQERDPDPGRVGYSGPPVVGLMGYRGPYPVESSPEPRKRVAKVVKDDRLAREVAQEFNSFGWVR